jgi:hypothetical protein
MQDLEIVPAVYQTGTIEHPEAATVISLSAVACGSQYRPTLYARDPQGITTMNLSQERLL